MTTSGKVSVEMEVRESGAAASAKAIEGVNKELGKFAALNLEGVLSLMGRAKGALLDLWAAAEAGEAANNIQVVFEKNVRRSEAALQSARAATADMLDDTTLQKRLLVLQRMNLEIGDQARLLGIVTKLVVTSGHQEEAVWAKTLAALKGGKTSLQEYGIEIKDTTNALGEMETAVASIDLEEMETGVASASTAVDNLKSSLQSLVASGFNAGSNAARDYAEGVKRSLGSQEQLAVALDRSKRSGESWVDVLGKMEFKEGQVVRTTRELDRVQEEALLDMAINLEKAGGKMGKLAAETFLATAQQDSFNESIRVSIKLLEKVGGIGFRAAPGKSEIGAGNENLNAKIEKERSKEIKKRKGGSRSRKKADEMGLEDFDGLFDRAISGGDAQHAKQTAELEKALGVERLQLEVQVLLGEKQAFRMDMLREEQNIQRLMLERQQGAISLEERDLGIQAARLRAKKAQSKEFDKGVASFKSFLGLDKEAPKKTKNEVSLENQMSLYQGVGKAAMELAGQHAKNEQERAAIGAVMAVLDAGMASIRLISDMGVAGIPLAAATMALGVATAAGYASAGGGASRGGGASPFQGFTATAINERPDASGAPVVMNFNAPVVGGSSQEIAAQLGEFQDSGGMRRSAA